MHHQNVPHRSAGFGSAGDEKPRDAIIVSDAWHSISRAKGCLVAAPDSRGFTDLADLASLAFHVLLSASVVMCQPVGTACRIRFMFI